MENTLSNTASAVGNYNDIPTSVTSTASVVTMVNGLAIAKTADKQVLVNGNLTYTIVINNQTERPYNDPEMKDVIDISLVNLVEDSITIDGASAQSSDYNYESSTGTLTINLESIPASSSKTVTFQVTKK